MHALFPFLAAIIGSGNVIYEKYFFGVHKIKSRFFVPVVFSFVFLFLSLLFYPFLGSIKDGAFHPINLFILAVVLIISPLRNVLYYKSFKREGLCEIEPFLTFTPLLTVIIAGIVYPEERRHWVVLVLALVAALALILAHVKKKHLKLNKYLVFIIIVVLLEAIENNLIKSLLDFYSPVAMYTVRSGFIALVLTAIFKPKLKNFSSKELLKMAGIGMTWVLTVIFAYYGYREMGVVYTSLVLMLNPILIMFGSYFFLKDKKFTKRNLVAMAIVLSCVVIAQFFE